MNGTGRDWWGVQKLVNVPTATQFESQQVSLLNDGGDSPMTWTASSMLTGPAGARLEHRILNGARLESVVG